MWMGKNTGRTFWRYYKPPRFKDKDVFYPLLPNMRAHWQTNNAKLKKEIKNLTGKHKHKIWHQHCGTTVETQCITETWYFLIDTHFTVDKNNNNDNNNRGRPDTHATQLWEGEARRLQLRPDPHLATTSVRLQSIWPEAEAEIGPDTVWPTSVSAIHT